METLAMFVKAFLVGGAICTLGQIIINFTHLTNGKILVIFLIAGAILEGFGVYSKLIDFAGAGASVPISGFGSALVKGALKGAKEDGIILFKGLHAVLCHHSAGLKIILTTPREIGKLKFKAAVGLCNGIQNLNSLAQHLGAYSIACDYSYVMLHINLSFQNQS